jgi:hypothetical protein
MAAGEHQAKPIVLDRPGLGGPRRPSSSASGAAMSGGSSL